MWAAVNYAKFNRMARKLLHYQVKAYGSDLFRPSMHHTDEFISKLTYDGVVVLYLNNRILQKKLDKIKLAIPTHYVVLQNIHKDGNTLTMQYWDYGSKTQRQMTPSFFRKLVFGISYCTKKRPVNKWPARYILAFLTAMTLVACTGKNITGKFYTDHREQIDTIKTLLKNSTAKSHSHSRSRINDSERLRSISKRTA